MINCCLLCVLSFPNFSNFFTSPPVWIYPDYLFPHVFRLFIHLSVVFWWIIVTFSHIILYLTTFSYCSLSLFIVNVFIFCYVIFLYVIITYLERVFLFGWTFLCSSFLLLSYPDSLKSNRFIYFSLCVFTRCRVLAFHSVSSCYCEVWRLKNPNWKRPLIVCWC